MATQGMNVNPNDLDIVIQLRDLRRIKDIFSNYTPSSIKELKISGEEPAWEIKITIGDLEVHILGERDTGKYVSKLLANRIIQMRLDDMEISCFTLDAEAQAYAETNRKNKADLINNFLKHNK
ncbi:MAG: hypothetical protein Q7S74_03565 [Nanoarchaeota archaeon]|nr:hypothetical protein [Nanoarchaeota archaeon]